MSIQRLAAYRMDFQPGNRPEGMTRSGGAYGEFFSSGTGLLQLSTPETREYLIGPNSVSGGSPATPPDTYLGFIERGWVIRPAFLTPDTPPGTVILPAQSVNARLRVTSSASNALALGTGTALLRASLWAINATDVGHTFIAGASGVAEATRGIGAGDPLATINVPYTEFPSGWTLCMQVGVRLTSPQPAIGSNTETYTVAFNNVNSAMTLSSPFLVRYDRTVSRSVPVQGNTPSRVVATTRRALRAVPAQGNTPSRVVATTRRTAEATALAALASRSVLFPRSPAVETVPPPVAAAIRQVTFRRTAATPVLDPSATASRTVSAARFAQQAALAEAAADRKVTFGRNSRQFLQPGEEPVIDPQRKIHVVVRNGDGTMHGAGAYVVLFRTDTNFPVKTGTTGPESEVVFPRNSFDANTYFVAAWDEDGTPLSVQAVSERGLIPEEV